MKLAWLNRAGNFIGTIELADHAKVAVLLGEKTSPNRCDTDYTIGEDNIRNWVMDFHNPVFIISALLVLLFVIGTLMFPGEAKQVFDGSKTWSIS